MDNTCDEMRLVIGASIGRPLDPDEQENLKRHLAECPSCRAYHEALLADDSLLDEYASCHADSLRRIREKATSARPIGTGTAPRLALVRRLSSVPRAARIAVAAAAAIAVIVAADFIRGAYFGPIPAFAAVIENARKAENVTFHQRKWLNGEWITEERSFNRSGASRIDYGDSILVDPRNDSWSLRLYPAKKLAVVRQSAMHPRLNSGRDKDNAVERIATWHKKHSFTFVRRERHEGKNIAIFESTFESEFEKSKAAKYPRMRAIHRELELKDVVWVDLETTLPVRIDMINSLPRFTAESGPCGLQLRDFMPPAAQQDKATGWIELRHGEPGIIWDDFKWNASVDTSLFSMNPPADYTIQRIPETKVTDGRKLSEDFIPGEAYDIQEGLAEWIPLFGNTFPDSLSDMADVDRIRPRLIARYNADGVPGDEYRHAIHAALQMEDGARPGHISPKDLERRKDLPGITYVGRGCTFGDSTKAICWLRRGKDSPYWIIYADLHMIRSDVLPRN